MGTVNITADSALVQRGSFSQEQVATLLGAVNPKRVVHSSHVKPHLSQQDVRAHLIRVFGFGATDVDVIDSSLVFEQERTPASGSNAAKWDVCYSAKVRLTVRNTGLVTVASYEDVSTATAENQARGAAHDLALKSAVSLAMKRAATYLGDQFGLSLYNKGQESALVIGTLVGVKRDPAAAPLDVQAGVPQQLEDGLGDALDDDEGEQVETPAPSALPKPRKRATNGTQGTKRAVAAPEAPEAVSEAPVAAEQPMAYDTDRAEAQAEGAAVAASIKADRAADVAPKVDQQAKLDEIAADREAAKAKRAEIAQQAKLNAEELSRAELAQAEADEREQRAIIAAEQDALQAKREADEAAEHADQQTGEVAETGAEVAARIKADRAARAKAEPAPVALPKAEAEARVKAEPEPWAEGTDWRAALAAATSVAQAKAVWDGAVAAQQMTTELRMEIIKRKARIESAASAASAPADEQPPLIDEER